MEFLCRIISPQEVIFDGSVEQVNAANAEGEFGVLAQHVNFITALTPCPLTLKLTDGSLRIFAVEEGLAEVKDGVMTIVVPKVLLPEEIDQEQLRKDIDELRKRLATEEFGTDSYNSIVRSLASAEAKLRAAQLAGGSRHGF